MFDTRKAVGRRGEGFAAAFFRTKGFQVIGQNWNCRLGEIDLIVEKDGEVRFVEVKMRFTKTYGYPEEAITKKKLEHLARAIELWLRTQPHPPLKYQADALAILFPENREPDVQWIQNIL